MKRRWWSPIKFRLANGLLVAFPSHRHHPPCPHQVEETPDMITSNLAAMREQLGTEGTLRSEGDGNVDAVLLR